MKVGDKFSTFTDFEAAFSDYKKSVLNEFTIRDARTLGNQERRCPATVKNANPNLKYYHLRLYCVKGGRRFKQRNENTVRKCYTMKQECKASIFLKLSECKQFIEVKELNEVHNHPSSKLYFSSLPQQRISLPSDLKDVKQILKSKTYVLDDDRNATGDNMTLNDLTNIKPDEKNFQKSILLLENNYKCTFIEILVDSNGNFKGLFFQDERMQNYMKAFPEVLFIDCMHCPVDLKTATYVATIIDGNGVSEIVGIGLLVDETEESIEFFINSFKANNPTWVDVKVVMSDKDRTERKVFSKHFPDAKLVMCHFHVLKQFNKDITTKKMKISPEDVLISKKYLQKLTKASSQEEYIGIILEMERNVPEIVIQYFNDNWATIDNQWVQYLTFQNLCLSNSTNSQLESINTKLKSVVTKNSLLEEFIEHVFTLINTDRESKDIKIALSLSKISAKRFPLESPKRLYRDFLTSFAFESVENQIDLMESVKDWRALYDDIFIMTTTEGLLKVSATSCECLFRKSNKLPCCHILKCREILKLPVFDQDLCEPRWTREFTKELLDTTIADADADRQDSCDGDGYLEEDNNINQSQPLKKINQQYDTNTFISASKKFKMADSHGKVMAQLCSDVPTPVFLQRIMILKNIINIWSLGNDELLENALSLIFEQNHDNQEINILNDNVELDGSSDEGEIEVKFSTENDFHSHAEQHDANIQQKLNSIVEETLGDNCYTEVAVEENSNPETILPIEVQKTEQLPEKDHLAYDCIEEVVERADNQDTDDEFVRGTRNGVYLKDSKMPVASKKRGRPKILTKKVTLKRKKTK